MKTFVKVLLLLVAVGYFAFAMVRFLLAENRQICTSLSIAVHAPGEADPVIDTAFVHNLLVRHKYFPEGRRAKDIPLAEIDSVLEAHPYIREALVYVDAGGCLEIEVTTHEPIMHVIPDGESAYLISAEGHIMPVGDCLADLPLASGHISQSYAKSQLAVLARILAEDELWDDQIGQVYVGRDSVVTLVPRVGDHTIRLGKLKGVRRKLAHMRTFYTQALPQIGWNRYKEINLEYDNQIIATRKNR